MNRFKIYIIKVLFLFFGVHNLVAQVIPVCTVDVSKPGAEIAPVGRGQQIEEFNHQFQGGLYAQSAKFKLSGDWRHFTCELTTQDAENSLANPFNIVPVSGTFISGKSFEYLFPAYSVTVLRVGLQ